MVVTGKYLFRSVRGVDCEPGAGSRVEYENFAIAIFTLKATIEDDFFGRSHRNSVMRDATGTATSGLNEFPF